MNEKLGSLAGWSKFVGWVMFIGGLINAIGGVFAFVIGAIPGVIMAIMGWKLISAANNVTQYKDGINNEQAFYNMVSDYATYFKINGILLIIALVFAVIGIIIFVAAFGYIMQNLQNLQNLQQYQTY